MIWKEDDTMNLPTGVIVFLIVFVLLVFGGFAYVPYRHKKWRDYQAATDTFYPLEDIDEDRSLDKIIGKLVRKVIDKPPVWRNPRLYGARNGIDPIFKKKDFFWKYYLTFETFEGYKSFTVTKAEYSKYRTNSYGYIFFQDTRFSHFEIHNREDMNLDALIRQHRN